MIGPVGFVNPGAVMLIAGRIICNLHRAGRGGIFRWRTVKTTRICKLLSLSPAQFTSHGKGAGFRWAPGTNITGDMRALFVVQLPGTVVCRVG